MKAKKIFVMLAVTAALCTACSNSNGDPQGGAAQTAQEAQESGQPETQAEKPEQKEGTAQTEAPGQGDSSGQEAAPEQTGAGGEVTKDSLMNYPVTDESAFTVIDKDDGVKIKKYKNDEQSSVIVVPETIGGKKVVSIGTKSFSKLSGVEAIVLPDSVEKTDECAFNECEDLKYVHLGTGLKSVDNMTFKSCHALTEIELPEGTSAIYGTMATDCPALKSITVPASVETIELGLVKDGEFSGVIRTPAGSAAEKYAKEHGLKVENY